MQASFRALRAAAAPATLAALAAAAISAAAGAHNSWLVTDRQRAEVGQSVRVAFVTAHDSFPAGEHATDPARVAGWITWSAQGRRDVRGYAVDGNDLAVPVKLESHGLHVFAVALQSRFIELAPDDFRSYLQEERADAALAARERRGTAGAPGRERYTKFGKAFVEAGESPDDRAFLDTAGHALEIVPLSHPCRWQAGDVAEVRVLANGRPAPALHVASGHESLGGHAFVQIVQTDDRGIARLRLDRPGLWFVRTHVIRELGEGDARGDGAEWESFWASITFRVSAGAGTQGLSLHLAPATKTIRLGDFPEFDITVRNGGPAAVTLVRPGDGSDLRWRTPLVGWSVIPEADREREHPCEMPLAGGSRCGNTNPLQAGEVLTLAAGSELALSGWTGFPRFPGPGRYRVIFYYANEPSLEWSGVPLGEHDAATMAAVRASTPCHLLSNQITVIVEPAAPGR